ncbi:MAG: Hydratase/decarboxylase [Proteobacteria bacterium]|nr:Hydratase/decarboxylase [Pseudomonadota bacterium]
MRHALCFSLISVVIGSAHAACPSPETMSGIARQWQEMTPASGLDKDMSMADAACGRQLLIGEFARTQGRVVGYKAGLTNTAVQKRFGTDAPVRGTLFEKMLVSDGVELPAKFGTRPVFEADLVVEVKDEGINQAQTPAEVLQHISRIIPFIELPDLLLDPKETINGATLTAINAGTRLGVLGQPVTPTAAHLEALASMSVVVRDAADGNKELARGPGTAILDHPLNAVIWLARDIARDGGKLKAGDLLSLGSFTPLMPPRPGMHIQVSYEGLPGMPSVGVKFK